MHDFFFKIRIIIHIIKMRLRFFFLSFEKILDQLKNQKKRSDNDIDVKKISNFIKKINKLIPGNSCLIDSVIIYTFLKNYKENLEFIIGVRKDLSGKFMSHAWIEYNCIPLGESKNTNFKHILKIK